MAGAGSSSGRTAVRCGFIPLVDCATLVVAAEQGFATAEGIDLTLVREVSWANIRDHLNLGYLDCAHMLAGMPIAASLGIRQVRVPTMAPLALGFNGNAVTVSLALYRQMAAAGTLADDDPVGMGAALRRMVAAGRAGGGDPPTFGMVFPFSCHNYDLRYWLAASRLDPDRDVRLVVIPPPLMVESLSAGLIDGFCVGEPWSSLAVDAGVGRIILTKRAIWRHGPEKVLGMRTAWADANPDLVAALVRALVAAAAWAGDPANHGAVAALLAAPAYLDVPEQVVMRALAGRLAFSPGGPERAVPEFLVLHGHAATVPRVGAALWIYAQMRRWGQAPRSPGDVAVVRQVFRPDLYRRALGGGTEPVHAPMDAGAVVPTDELFDGVRFDPDDLDGYLASLPLSGSAASPWVEEGGSD